MALWHVAAVVLLAVAFVAGGPSGGTAQDDARSSALARSLFQEGLACADSEDWSCAVDRFGRAYGLRTSPVIGSNYALALMHVDRLLEAAEIFRAVLRDRAATAQLRSDATQFIAEIEPRLAHVTLHVDGPMDGVSVTVDGHDDTSLIGVSTPCDPGDLLVEAHRDGAVVATTSAHVDAGGTIALDLTVPERPPAPADEHEDAVAPLAPVIVMAPAPPPLPEPPIYEQWWLWTIVGVAVVGIGVGVGVGVGVGSGGTTLPMGSLGVVDGRQ